MTYQTSFGWIDCSLFILFILIFFAADIVVVVLTCVFIDASRKYTQIGNFLAMYPETKWNSLKGYDNEHPARCIPANIGEFGHYYSENIPDEPPALPERD